MKIREFAMNRSRTKRAGLSLLFFFYSLFCVCWWLHLFYSIEKLPCKKENIRPHPSHFGASIKTHRFFLNKQTKQSQRSRRWIHEEHDVRRARISRRCSRFSRHVVPSRVQRWRRSGRGVRLCSGVRLVEHNRGETCVHRKGESYWAEN